MYLTEWEEFEFERDHTATGLIWNEELEYGNWEDGPYGDGTRKKTLDLPIPEVG